MKIELDKNYTLGVDRWGYPILVRHDPGAKMLKDKSKGKTGHPLFYQTFGSAIKAYIMMRANDADVQSLDELAKFIDRKLESVEKTIDQQMEAYKCEK